MSTYPILSKLKELFFSSKQRFLGTLFGLVLLLAIPVTTSLILQQQDIRQRAAETSMTSWGKIANPELLNQKVKGIFFFAGPPNPSSTNLYTRHPFNQWSQDNSNVDFIFDQIQRTGTNTIKLSWWGPNNENLNFAPTVSTIDVNKTTFEKANARSMMVAPVIEVSDSFKFYSEFPSNTANLEARIKSLLETYGNYPNWLKLYDKTGQPRKVIWLIETIHAGAVNPQEFAQAFDTVANKIEADTGQKIGFIIDPTPLPPNGSYDGPDPAALQNTQSLLAINPFNITSDGNTEAERLTKAEEILKKWKDSGLPVMVNVLPGYDDHIVRPPGQMYGDNPTWRSSVETLAKDYETVGITLDIWNGFTEGYAFVPTTENGQENYNLAKKLFDSISLPPSSSYENEHLRIMPSPYITGIIDLFYKTPTGEWKQYNNIVPIARVSGVWGNAEIDKAAIAQNVVSQTSNETVVKYQFSPLPNGAHFYLLMTLTKNEPKVKFQAILNDDSKPVEALALGNYYGLVDLVQFIKINSTIYDALTYPKPDPDGNLIMGRFISLERPLDNKVEFWGKDSPHQYQSVDVPLSGQDEILAEIRFTPWLSSQPAPGKNWFETIHITRSPFTPDKSVWYFGLSLSTGPTATATPNQTCPAQGTNPKQVCSGNTLIHQYADGICGTSTTSTTCPYGCETHFGSGFCSAAPTATPTPAIGTTGSCLERFSTYCHIEMNGGNINCDFRNHCDQAIRWSECNTPSQDPAFIYNFCLRASTQ